MRQLTSHQVNRANEALTIEVLDEPGSGGANHLYVIRGYDPSTNASETGDGHEGAVVLFQNGPIGEVGVNGITHEALLAILIDRLERFQEGPYANEYNQSALMSLRMAQEVLHARTRHRQARGVEGTHQV